MALKIRVIPLDRSITTEIIKISFYADMPRRKFMTAATGFASATTTILAALPHSLQGLVGDGSEFLLVFDNGNFNEDERFLVTDWLTHTPKEVLAKNFGVAESAFAGIPEKELYIFESQVPSPLAADRVVGAGPVHVTYSHRLMDRKPIRTKGGRVRIVDSSVFPAARTISAALVEVEPGGIREMHGHPHSGVAVSHRGPIADDGLRLG
jgi:oxalate decarboxylase family bicupin protein